MAYISGTAANNSDFFEILLTFFQSCGWTLEAREQATNGNITEDWANVTSAGLSGLDSIAAGLGHVFNDITDTYAIRFAGFAGYLSSVSPLEPYNQPENTVKSPRWSGSVYFRFPLHRNEIQYWLVGNKRRVMGAVFFNGRWQAFHVGLILPYCMPSQYAYPMWVAACNTTTDSYQTNTNGCPWGASLVRSGMLWAPGGKWFNTPLSAPEAMTCGQWPWHGQGYFDYAKITPIKDRLGVEQFAILPIIMHISNPDLYGTFGQPEGLYYICGWGVTPGDTIEAQGRTYLIIQREKSTEANTCAAMLLE